MSGINNLIASTFTKASDITDNVIKSTPLFNWLKEKGSVKVTSGKSLTEPVIDSFSTQAVTYAKGDTISIAEQEVIDLPEFNWKRVAVSIKYDEFEAMLNSGKEQFIDFVDVMKDSAKATLVKKMAEMLYSDGTGNGGKDFLGLGSIIATDPTTVSVGGVSTAQTYWHNQRDTVASFTATGMSVMHKVFTDCRINMGLPEAIFTGINGWRGLEAQGYGKLEIRYDNANFIDLGIDTFKYKGVPVYYDYYCPDDKMYFVNSKNLKLKHHPKEWFAYTPEMRAVDQPDQVAMLCKLKGELITNNRRGLGVITISNL